MEAVIVSYLKSVGGITTGSVVVLLILGKIFWKSFIGLIEKDVKKDVEKYKHELDIKKENIKHDMGKEMLKEQFLSNSLQSVYPELIKNILIAEGAMASLTGLRFSANWDEYGENDFEKLFIDKGITQKKSEELLAKIKADRTSGVKDMDKYLRMLDINEARRQYREAKNFFLLKNLFISDSVEEMVNDILKKIWSNWVDISSYDEHGVCSGVTYDKISKDQSDIQTSIDDLQVAMRKELLPCSANN